MLTSQTKLKRQVKVGELSQVEESNQVKSRDLMNTGRTSSCKQQLLLTSPRNNLRK